jgi:hypothetical protein
MINSCVVVPEKGTGFFKELRAKYGYDTAVKLFNIASSSDFKKDFGKTLRLDSEGFPSLSSFLKVPIIKDYIGDSRIIESLEKDFKSLENTVNSYNALVEQAHVFNTRSEYKNDYVAIVKNVDGKLSVKITNANRETITKSREQIAAKRLNDKFAKIFEPLGFTVGTLTESEKKEGIHGVTDFNAIKKLGKDYLSIIRIANGIEGAEALSEENCHLIIGLRAEDHLVQRALSSIENNEELIKDILGDKYESYKSMYSKKVLAEEALGRILKNLLERKSYEALLPAPSLFSRFKNFILNLFKKINTNSITEAIAEAEALLTPLAVSIENTNTPIERHAIRKQQRFDKMFNLGNKPNNTKIGQLFSTLVGSQDNKDSSKHENLSSNVIEAFNNTEEGTVSSNANISKLFEEAANNAVIKSEINIVAKTLAKILEMENKRNVIGNVIESKNNDNKEVLISDIENALELLDPESAEFNMSEQYKAEYYMTCMQNYLVYSYNELKQCQVLMQELIDKDKTSYTSSTFKTLTLIRDYVTAIAPMIKDIYNVAANKKATEESSLLDTPIDKLNGHSVLSMLGVLTQESELLMSNYQNVAIPAFTAFLSTYYGSDHIKMGDVTISIEDIVKKARNGDISAFELWLDSMADSSDEFLQLVDFAMKSEKENARQRSIEWIKVIQSWAKKAEAVGFTDFSWLLEKDNEGNNTGYYATRYREYELKKEVKRRLKEEEHLDPSQRMYYVKQHQIDKELRESGEYINEDWAKHVNTPEKEKIIEEFYEIKHKLDTVFGNNPSNKAVQVRKSGSDRVMDTFKHPTTMLEEIKNAYMEGLMLQEDDIEEGIKSKTTTTRFDGSEYHSIPKMYTTFLKNPEELSTDLPASLMKYAHAACEYQALKDLENTMEVGRVILKDYRDIPETKGGSVLKKKLFAKQKALKKIIGEENIQSQSKRIYTRYIEYLKNEMYHMYSEDAGSFPFFTKRVNTNKLVSLILRGASSVQMGFNFLSNGANAAMGTIMTQIEVTSSQFISAESLLFADKTFAEMLLPYIAQKGSKAPDNKLYLFMELFDTRERFKEVIKDKSTKDAINRLLGARIGSIGQDAGDLWLYNRTAIAYLKNTKVKHLQGDSAEFGVPEDKKWEETTLWDLLEIRTINGEKIMRFKYDTIYHMDGRRVQFIQVKEAIHQLNRHLFGIYNQADSNVLNRYVLGKLVMHYRKFMVPMFNYFFAKESYDIINRQERGGIMTATYGFLKGCIQDLHKGELNIMLNWDKLTERQQKGVWKTLASFAFYIALSIASGYFDDDDDDEKSEVDEYDSEIEEEKKRKLRLAEYYIRRLKHELGFFVPSLTMVKEWSKQAENPIPSKVVIQNIINCLNSALTPEDWTNEIDRGKYEGMSTLEKHLYKSPLPGVSAYRQIDNFLNHVDDAILFYRK